MSPWKSSLLPTLGDVAERSDSVTFHCYQPKCEHIEEAPISELIAALGRDVVFVDLKYRLCCPRCKGRNISISATNSSDGAYSEMNEKGALDQAIKLHQQDGMEALSVPRSRIRARLAGGHIKQALYWATVRGAILGLNWRKNSEQSLKKKGEGNE